MADDITVARPEPIPSPAPSPAAPAPEPVDPDAAHKTWLKERGLDPDHLDEYRAAREQLPRHQQALVLAQELLKQAYPERPAPQPFGAPAEPAAAAPVTPEYIQSLLARHARGVDEIVAHRLTSQKAAETADQRLRQEWPEAYDASTDLHKEGMKIYWQEMSDAERASPMGHLVATERAAGRLGLGPTSRRGPDVVSGKSAESAGQNVGRGGRRPAEEELPKLTARERSMAEAMEIDPKRFAEMKKHRQSGANVRVE